MFAHDVNAHAGSESVADLLIKITNGPPDEDTYWNRIAAIVIGAWPELLNIPNPMKHWADMLRTELGRIAQDAWDAAERDEIVGGMDARAIEVLRACFQLLWGSVWIVMWCRSNV